MRPRDGILCGKTWKVTQMCHDLTRQDTHNDTRNTFNADFPVFSTNGDKMVVWRECDGAYVLRVFDESELGVCRRVPKGDSMVCGVCDECSVLW